MGQQSIQIRNRNISYNEGLEEMRAQAKEYYFHKYFLLGNGEDRERRINAQLLEKILCTTNCDLIDWIWKKYNGLLDDVKQGPLSVDKLTIEYNVYNVNNYITQEANWSEVEW